MLRLQQQRFLCRSLIVQDTKFVEFQKDPEFFWLLSHSPHASDSVIASFRRSDAADTKFVQQSLKSAFQSKFAPESDDVVYDRDTRDFDVFVLLKKNATNSCVMVLTK